MQAQKVHCEFCGEAIPSERLEILPETTTCVKCSQIQPYSEAEINSLQNIESDEPTKLDTEEYEENSDRTFLSISDLY